VHLLLKQNKAHLIESATLSGMRRALWIVAAAGLIAVLVIGLTQAGDHGGTQASSAKPFDLGTAKRQLAGAPAPLSGLYDQSNQLLGGGLQAFDRRIDTLRGHPVVINKWASWCRPCRAEFPIFEQVATARGKSVAFLGLNGKDKQPAAEKFLASQPLPYPSYQDPSEAVARRLEAPSFYPMTVFLDRHGRMAYTHTGEYTSAQQLTTDIDRYLR
jgi:cytochrome c biogenesis protein CcmG, thiol:disulfide interchange protein DsbE